MKDKQIHEAMVLLNKAVEAWQTPAVTIVAQRQSDPYKVLVSCILSLRTKDKTTAIASDRLFAMAATPVEMLNLSATEIEKAIYPVGFYRVKSKQIVDISRELVDKYQGKVPDDIDTLLKFRGVGRKTANLVVILGFGKPGICVDTHVHRICNRWGYVATSTPEQTEYALRKKLPKEYWLTINDLLVTFGQNQCTPVSPRCSNCVLSHLCERKGVAKSR
jgi:endonuclease-3